MLKCKEDVGSIKLCSVLLKAADLAQVEKELTTWAVLKAEVQLALSLESEIHLDNELMMDTLENTALVKRVFQLVSAQNLSLLQYFESVHLLSVFFLHKKHLSIASLSDHFDCLEVTHANSSSPRQSTRAHLLHLVNRFLICCFLMTQTEKRDGYFISTKARVALSEKHLHRRRLLLAYLSLLPSPNY